MKKVYSVTMSFSATVDIEAKDESEALDKAQAILDARCVTCGGERDERFDNRDWEVVGMEAYDEET